MNRILIREKENVFRDIDHDEHDAISTESQSPKKLSDLLLEV